MFQLIRFFRKYLNGFFFISLVTACMTMNAQEIDSMSEIQSKSVQTDSIVNRLPSLEVLIDSAIAHTPLLKMHQLDVKLQELQISSARKNWSKNIISGSASYNYGDNLILNESLGIGQLSTDSKAESHYSVGLALKIPITLFFDHQDEKRAMLELERTEAEKIVILNNIREEVNQRYLNLVNAYQRYKILLDDYGSYEIDLQYAERDFINSRITIQEVNAVKVAFSKAKLDLADAKNNMNNSIWLLEELVGFKLKL